MARPSILYRSLGDQVLFDVSLDTNQVISDAQIVGITTQRGGTDASAHAPSTASVQTTRLIDFASQSVSIDLRWPAAQWLAARCFTTPEKIAARFYGRRAGTTAHDLGRRGWQRTDLTAASWDSLLPRFAATWQPAAGSSMADGVAAILNPNQAPVRVSVQGTTDTWFEAPAEPISSGDLLNLFADRLYLFCPQRDGLLIIRTLAEWHARAWAANTTSWPLGRAHVIAPITWEQPIDAKTPFLLRWRTPAGTQSLVSEGGSGLVYQLIDWRDLVTPAGSNQVNRIYGHRARTSMLHWSLPTIRVRLDKLIGDPREDHRRAAGMLLGLEIGDPVPLSGDWPQTSIRGIAYCAGVREQISHAGWWMELDLLPYRWLDGQQSITARPRTWAQTLTAWGTPTEPWQEGPST